MASSDPAPPGDRPRSILLVESSTAFRRRLTHALSAQGLHVEEAVDVMDAAYLMTQRIPDSMVIASSLPGRSGLDFARNLGKLDKTKHRPIVLLLDDDAAMEAVVKLELRAAIVPVLRSADIGVLVNAIVDAEATARRVTGELTPGPLSADAADPSQQAEADARMPETDQTRAMGKAIKSMDGVLKLIQTGQLPGPMMPNMLEQVRKVLADRKADFKKVANFIRRYQTLSARLMAMANSAHYARGAKSTTPEAAIARIGLSQTGLVLQALAKLDYVEGKDSGLRSLIVRSLEKSSFVALVAECLGKELGHADLAHLYTVGLFHNIGATFLLYALGLLQEKGQVEALEVEALSTVVDSRGPLLNKLVCRTLKLSDDIVRVFSFDPEELDAEPEHSTVKIVHRSIWVASRVLDHQQESLTLDAQAESAGVSDKHIEILNAAMPSLMERQGVLRS